MNPAVKMSLLVSAAWGILCQVAKAVGQLGLSLAASFIFAVFSAIEAFTEGRK